MLLGLIKAAQTWLLQRLLDFFSNVLVNVDLERKIRWKVQIVYPGWPPTTCSGCVQGLAESRHIRYVNLLICLFFLTDLTKQ